MNLRRIRMFLTVAETLNFSEAARLLGISQPALTKAIQRLEEELGGILILREGKNTNLTHLGRLMREHYQALDTVAVRAEESARQFVSGDMPRIQVAVMCTIGPTRFKKFLYDFKKAEPTAEIHLRDASRDRIFPMLLSGEVDCALIGSQLSEEPTLRLEHLYEEPIVVACAKSHSFASRGSIPFAEIQNESYLDRLHCEFRDTFIAKAERAGIDLMFTARSEREDWIQALVLDGLGITVLPAESLIINDICAIPISEPTMKRSVRLATPRGREMTTILRSFLDSATKFDW